MNTKFNFNCYKSHYVYKNGKAVGYVNVFCIDKNGCFTESQAIKFIADANRNSKLKYPVVFDRLGIQN